MIRASNYLQLEKGFLFSLSSKSVVGSRARDVDGFQRPIPNSVHIDTSQGHDSQHDSQHAIINTQYNSLA